MSGGFDSSAAALILMKKGYQVTGLTLNMLDTKYPGNRTPRVNEVQEAQKVAHQLGIEHHVLDVRHDFKNSVINNFINEYLSGRTPNPCIRCNTFIKWKYLANKASEYGCDYIASGHYARITRENSYYLIKRAKDESKDQSYFLWGLNQSLLHKTLFPLGGYKKTELKKFFEDSVLPGTEKKKDSMEICFIPHNNYRNFIKKVKPTTSGDLKNGTFVDTSGKYLGKHKGYPFYTIGQRRGLEVAVGYPLYVLKIIPETNTIVLGTREDLYSTELTVSQINFTIPEDNRYKFEATTKVRYNHSGAQSEIYRMGKNKLRIVFKDPVFAITPGQSAVFYEGNKLTGGGVIT